jgi:acyl carrier protein
MDELSMRARLAGCFQVVFPDIPAERIPEASQDTVAAWDSVAGITLITVVEDEFGIQLDLERLPELTSFTSILGYLEELSAAGNSPC